MLSKITDFVVAQLVLPMEDLQSIVKESVLDFRTRSTTDEFDEAIDDFNNRKNYENQLVVLTDVAEEDWDMPIDFELVFDIDDPSNLVASKILVQHIILERGLPVFYIERGFRHMLLLEFVDGIPDLVKSLVGYEDIQIDPMEVRRSRIGFGIFN